MGNEAKTYQIAADKMLIDGELVTASGGQWDPSINPATEEVIGRAPSATAVDVNRAVDAANRAWPEWAERTPAERASTMREFARRLRERSKELLDIEVADTGNTVTSLGKDVKSACDTVDYYAGLAPELKGETLPITRGNLHFTTREPYGVVARIVPFNHPILFAVARTAAALAAGNAVLVKPPETSPLSALTMAEVAAEVLPKGIFNIITGNGRDAGDPIVRHPDVRRISFIGSPQTGMAIQRAAAETNIKHVSLELGGKNPMIIFPDVDVEEAANAAIAGMNFAWQGQSCSSTSRLLLHADIYDEVVERIREKVAKIVIGNPADPASQMGPMNSRMQLDKVLHYIDVAKNDGARLLAGGGRPEGADFKRGFWVQPTVFTDVTSDMRIAQEEVFGPILSIIKWHNVDEAIRIANSTEYGLTAAIWTHDIDAALTTAKRVNSGFQWINGYSAHYIGMPFGGMKNSGIGREEGIEEMLSYTQLKSINLMLRPPKFA